jgi:hypothetical protein
MVVLALYNPILLRGIDTRMLVSGSFLFKKFPHREEFSTIINPNVGYRYMTFNPSKVHNLGQLGCLFMYCTEFIFKVESTCTGYL